jgi:hypothetical protein
MITFSRYLNFKERTHGLPNSNPVLPKTSLTPAFRLITCEEFSAIEHSAGGVQAISPRFHCSPAVSVKSFFQRPGAVNSAFHPSRRRIARQTHKITSSQRSPAGAASFKGKTFRTLEAPSP